MNNMIKGNILLYFYSMKFPLFIRFFLPAGIMAGKRSEKHIFRAEIPNSDAFKNYHLKTNIQIDQKLPLCHTQCSLFANIF